MLLRLIRAWGKAVPERFDEIIQATLSHGAETHHEATPADFGNFAGRRSMFTRCLAVLIPA